MAKMSGEKNPMFGKHHSAETRIKISKACIGKPSPRGMLGKHHSDDTKQKIHIALKGKKCFWYGKYRSEETKEKISEAKKGRHVGEKNHRWKGGLIKFICKICGKESIVKAYRLNDRRAKCCSKKCQGIWHSQHMIGKDNPKWVEKIKIICLTCKKEFDIIPSRIKTVKFCCKKCSSNWNVKHQKKENTSIEIAIENELIRRKIPFSKQTLVEGIALVDFLLSNKIIIQADGSYWHSRKINHGRDISQDTEFFFKGYKVFRFTEIEIKKSAKRCIDKIVKIIGEEIPHRNFPFIKQQKDDKDIMVTKGLKASKIAQICLDHGIGLDTVLKVDSSKVKSLEDDEIKAEIMKNTKTSMQRKFTFEKHGE